MAQLCFIFTVLEWIHARKIAIGHRSPVSFRSVIDPSKRSIKPVIASRDHITVNIFYGSRCFLCQFYKYFHNAINLNINLYFYFTFVLFLTNHPSFYITKLRSDQSPVIGFQSISDQSVNSHLSIKPLRWSVQGLYIEWFSACIFKCQWKQGMFFFPFKSVSHTACILLLKYCTGEKQEEILFKYFQKTQTFPTQPFLILKQNTILSHMTNTFMKQINPFKAY